MIVVADTSPLNYLAAIGSVDVLPVLFGEVLIPPAVASELSDVRTPPASRKLITNGLRWIRVLEPTQESVAAIRSSAMKLGLGGVEAIALAMDSNADLLLIDERPGTREARARHLRVTGLLGVLRLASLRGLVDLPACIDQLKKTTFRLPRDVVSKLLSEHTARRQPPAQ